jgi:murein DD-endopeptidase MepM/ murein hydrolase activator NlpD
LFRIRINGGVAAIVTALALVIVPAATAGAGAPRCKGNHGGGIGAGGHPCHPDGSYVNPFKGQGWYPGRTDMGVDYSAKRKQPMRAIGDARVIGSQSHNGGWPEGHFIWYRLLSGDHRGDIIYVAENLTALVPSGTYVRAGHPIGTALPGGTGIEMGWATKAGSTRAGPCYREGAETNSGKEMARFLRKLGAQTESVPGPGPNFPTGRLC